MPASASFLHIDASDAAPVSRQIERETREALAGGLLRRGDRLPPSRELARLLVVSPMATRKAYRELVHAGLCEPEAAGGLRVVAPRPSPAAGSVAGEPSDPWVNELELARDVQVRLLPPTRVEGRGFQVAARSYPARVIAGDFYDVLPQADGSVGVVVADVAGKGLATGLIMALVKAMVPFLAAERSPAAILRELNRRLHAELGARRFVALAYVRVDPAAGSAQIASAGLPAPVLLRSGQAPVELSPPGPRLPLGLRPEVPYRALEIELAPSDRLLVYTDGLPESLDAAGEPLGYEALTGLLRAAHLDGGRLPADRWLDHLLRRVLAATGRPEDSTGGGPGTLDDDLTALLLEHRAPVRDHFENREPSR